MHRRSHGRFDRRSMLLLALPLALPACGNGTSNRARSIGGLADFGALATDPERNRFCAGDAASGRLVVLDAADGQLQFDVPSAGQSVGGLLYEACSRSLYVSISARGRLSTFDPVTMIERSSIRLPSAPFALAEAAEHTLLIVTANGVVHFDPVSRSLTTLLPTIARDALVVSDRDSEVGWVAETVAGATTVHRLDLVNLTTPPTSSAVSLAGEVVGLAVSWDSSRLYVGTNVAPGIHILDAATLAEVDAIDVGDGLTSLALNSTGLRLFWSTGGPLVESVIVEPPFVGPTVALLEGPRPRGLELAPNGQDLACWSDLGVLATYDVRTLSLRAPAVLRQGETGTMELHGEPKGAYLVLLSSEPGAFILDPRPVDDPRLVETSLTAGFQVVASGTFDANGDAVLTDVAPTGANEALDTVWQVAQAKSATNPRLTLSNAMVIRFLGPECQ